MTRKLTIALLTAALIAATRLWATGTPDQVQAQVAAHKKAEADQAAAAEPAPTKIAVSQPSPAAAQPAPAQSAPAQPAPVQPPAAKPAPVLPAPDQSPPADPAPMTASSQNEFKAFQLIEDRNIFDMSRTGRALHPKAVHVPKVDDFGLVGTMSYEHGQYAFFDGSASEYQETKKPAETIGGFKIATIGSDYVELQATNGTLVKMRVGMGVRREDNGPWSPPTARAGVSFADSGSRSRDRADQSDRSSRSSRTSRRDRGSSRSSRGGSGADPGATATTDPNSDSSASSTPVDPDIVKRLQAKHAKDNTDDQ